eukprot:TRINITY_DN66286_c5_g4_i1.p1 TRINITY_DN66286_c5_g4~~TRINITY_DN66286_c5_g4_i1.p1  ORF type:complete len:314 (+),score=187.96 TRINITY_DN66286_c5_g4_i1:95-943(+)
MSDDDFKAEGPSAEFIMKLREEGKKFSADDISRDTLYKILEDGKDVLAKTDDDSKAAIDAAVKELIEDDDEKLVKGWDIVFHNSVGKEQERLLIATTKALYRVKYDYKEGKVDHFERMDLKNIQVIEYGQFNYSTGIFPSIGGILLKSAINKLYGFRIHNKEKPKSTPLPIPFVVDKYIDQCFRTFRPVIPKDTAEDAFQGICEAVTHEIVFSLQILMRTDPDFIKESPGGADTGKHYNPVSGPKQISITVTRGIVAAIHNKAGMGASKKDAGKEDGGDKDE